MEEQVEWPSKRIPHGGMFHLPKPNFSKETQDLIKLLMDEAHLTMMQRKKINYHLRNGDPLPPPEFAPPQCDDEKMQAYNIMMKVRNIRKRSLDSIKASGAFEPERYIPPRRKSEPSHLAKIRLQEFMSGIKEYPDVDLLKVKNKYKHKKVEDGEWMDPVNEILKEIYERADWLAEMEDLGEGKKHRDVIQLQIAERLRDIRRIQQQKRELFETKKLELRLLDSLLFKKSPTALERAQTTTYVLLARIKSGILSFQRFLIAFLFGKLMAEAGLQTSVTRQIFMTFYLGKPLMKNNLAPIRAGVRQLLTAPYSDKQWVYQINSQGACLPMVSMNF